MRLILGGVGQGKLAYALRICGAEPEQVAERLDGARTAPVLNHLERILRDGLAEGRDCRAELDEVLRANPNLIVLCDEVGCGVVPTDPSERLWRETVGRTCCELAQRAETVERVFCGLPMRLKG